MSKKTRKKTSKTPSEKTARGQSGGSGRRRPQRRPARPPACGKATAAKQSAKKCCKPRKTAVAQGPRSKATAQSRQAAKAAASQQPTAPKPRPVAAKSGLGRGRQGAGVPLAARRRRIGFAGGFRRQKLVLFFYPRADTPGCTKEAIDFTRLSSAFAESRTAVLGVSADPLKAQEAFRDKHQLSVPLVSDETARDAGGLWRLGRKIHVWQNLPWNSSHNGFDRRRRPDHQDLAPCQGRRPCRRGAGSGTRRLISAVPFSKN